MPIRTSDTCCFFLMLVIALCSCISKAQESEVYLRQTHTVRPSIPGGELSANFGVVYLAQWSVYYATQHETIEEHGSIDNWKKNPFRANFDKDHFDYNISKHTLTGQYYYLFYRSRGYTEKDSFLWAMASSLAFEFTVETLTEPPSYQDIYQTPVFGTVAGMAFERLSHYFHSLNTIPTTVLGYILNPLALLPGSYYEIRMTPEIRKDHSGVAVTIGF